MKNKLDARVTIRMPKNMKKHLVEMVNREKKGISSLSMLIRSALRTSVK